MLGLGFGLSITPRWAPWTGPASLFASGEQGGWYDPSDLSSMFQDSAGTTPAAVGQPVGLIRDGSGRGNDLTQPAAASRPVLRQDAGGRHYLEFDGSDDFLQSGAPGLRITGPLTLAAAYQRETASRWDMIMSCQTEAASTNAFEWRTQQTAGDAPMDFVAGNASFAAVSSGSCVVPIGAPRIVSAMRTGSAVQFRSNGQASSAAHTLVPTADANSQFRLGSRQGSTLFMQGRIYDALLIARTLAGYELEQLRAHQAAKAGVTL
jgi:hypothetical protein